MKEKAAELAKKVKGDPTIHPDYLQLDTAAFSFICRFMAFRF